MHGLSLHACYMQCAAGRHIANEFRTERLYTEEVDLVLKRHQVLLKAIYSRYRLKPAGGGLRTKMLKLEGWNQLLNDAHFLDGHFTIQVGRSAHGVCTHGRAGAAGVSHCARTCARCSSSRQRLP